jgi:phage tail tube protein FII
VARQDEDTEAGQIIIAPVKYIAVVMPKSLNLGNLAPHSRQDLNGEYALRYFAVYVEGALVTEIDQLNYKALIDGVDYLASVRAALGK